jgi:hypothetical protein
MSGRALLVGLLGSLACAHRPPPPAETFAPTNDTPPPRGQPPPRGGEIPLPPPNPGAGPPDAFEQQQRFPTVQAQARREDRQRQRQQLQAASDVAVQPAAPPAEICDPVKVEDRVSCPLHPAAIEEVRDVPGGVVIRMRAGNTSGPRLARALTCQRALAQASPRERPMCPFLDTTTTTRVVQSGSRLEVHLTRAGDVDLLREQVHALTR